MKLLSIKKDFVIDKIAGEINIFNIDNSTLYSFNKTGSDIFEMIKKGFDDGKMIITLSKKYKISEKKAKKDINDFLKILSKNKIVFSSKQRKHNE